jgi:hypothetical protein
VCKVPNNVVVSCLKECNGIVLSVSRHIGKCSLLRVYRDGDTGKVYDGLTARFFPNRTATMSGSVVCRD